MSAHNDRFPGPCPDATQLRAWFDGALDADAAARTGRHVDRCGLCAAQLADLQREWRAIRTWLDHEDQAQAVDTTAALARVWANVAARTTPLAPIVAQGRQSARAGDLPESRWLWRVAASVVVAAATLAAIFLAADRTPVEASAEQLIARQKVQERQWRFERNTIRTQTQLYVIRRPGLPERRRTVTTWFSNVEGQEGRTSRELAEDGTLRSARWMKRDGWSAAYDGARNELVLDPLTSEFEALMPMLSDTERRLVVAHLEDLRWQVRPGDAAKRLTALIDAPSSQDRALTLQRLGLVRAGGVFIVTFEEKSPLDGPGEVTTVEEHFAVSDLAMVKELIRKHDARGRLIEEEERQVLQRGEADPAEYTRLMAEVDTPRPEWRLRRRTAREVVAWLAQYAGLHEHEVSDPAPAGESDTTQ